MKLHNENKASKIDVLLFMALKMILPSISLPSSIAVI